MFNEFVISLLFCDIDLSLVNNFRKMSGLILTRSILPRVLNKCYMSTSVVKQSFKSDISLDVLYPESRSRVAGQGAKLEDIIDTKSVNFTGYIPISGVAVTKNGSAVDIR